MRHTGFKRDLDDVDRKLPPSHPRKNTPRKIAAQRILSWFRVWVWVRVRMEGNLPGGNCPSTLDDMLIEKSAKFYF